MGVGTSDTIVCFRLYRIRNGLVEVSGKWGELHHACVSLPSAKREGYTQKR